MDRIIHNRGHVTKDKMDRVNAIIEENGFRKNIFASNLAGKKKFNFAVFLPNFDSSEYWKSQVQGIQKAKQDFEKFGLEIEYFHYNFDSNSFVENIPKVLEFKCDGLLFAPIFYEESIAFLEKYKKKETPIIMIDSNIKMDIPHFYIGQDSLKSGYLAGRLISFAAKTKREVLILKITREIESTSVYLQRIKGFYNYFDEHPELSNFNFTEITIKDSDIDQLKVEMFQNINSIFVPNSRAYIVARFLESQNLKGIRIIGYDLLEENIKYLNCGIIDFLINQKPEEQGYQGIQSLYKKVILQEDLAPLNFIPLEIIIKENYVS